MRAVSVSVTVNNHIIAENNIVIIKDKITGNLQNTDHRKNLIA